MCSCRLEEVGSGDCAFKGNILLPSVPFLALLKLHTFHVVRSLVRAALSSCCLDVLITGPQARCSTRQHLAEPASATPAPVTAPTRSWFCWVFLHSNKADIELNAQM